MYKPEKIWYIYNRKDKDIMYELTLRNNLTNQIFIKVFYDPPTKFKTKLKYSKKLTLIKEVVYK